MDGSPLLKIKDVARRLNVSTFTVARMIKDGRLQAVKIGSAVRVPVTEVERVIREGTRDTRQGG